MKQSRSLTAVFFTFFIDALSWAVVFPIFAPYFLNSHLVDATASQNERAALFAVFLALFSLGQFIGAPLTGELADRYGRKKVLLVTIFFTSACLVLTAWSTEAYSLIGLFAGRFLTGLFASNFFLCQTCVADLSPDPIVKAERFGVLSSLVGTSFVLGAFIGGKLSDPSINSSFSPSLPLWIASALALINFGLILWGFHETHPVSKLARVRPMEAFYNLKTALRTKGIKEVYTVYFLFLLSWMILFQFIPVIAVRRYGFSQSNIGDLALFMGICWVIGSGYINKLLARVLHKAIVASILLVFNIVYFFVILPDRVYEVFALLGLCAVAAGIIWPIYTTLLASLGKQHLRGKILGLSQAVQSGAMTLAPLIASAAFQKSFELPFFIGAFVGLVGTIFYWKHARWLSPNT